MAEAPFHQFCGIGPGIKARMGKRILEPVMTFFSSHPDIMNLPGKNCSKRQK